MYVTVKIWELKGQLNFFAVFRVKVKIFQENSGVNLKLLESMLPKFEQPIFCWKNDGRLSRVDSKLDSSEKG